MRHHLVVNEGPNVKRPFFAQIKSNQTSFGFWKGEMKIKHPRVTKVLDNLERENISPRKSKTTEAVANRGVDADAPRGEDEDQKKEDWKRRSAQNTWKM